MFRWRALPRRGGERSARESAAPVHQQREYGGRAVARRAAPRAGGRLPQLGRALRRARRAVRGRRLRGRHVRKLPTAASRPEQPASLEALG